MRARRPEPTQVLPVQEHVPVTTYEGRQQGQGLRVAIVASRFNSDITQGLLTGARDALAAAGVEPGSISVAWVPGAFEVPLAAQRMASSGDVDAVICLGAVIRGQTDHYTLVATQCAAGIQRAQLETGVPMVFGVLTTDTVEQAVARAGGDLGNIGEQAAAAALEMADLLRQLPKPVAPA